MIEPTTIAVSILAAGASTRLGQPKQLLPFRGKTLLQYQVDLVNEIAFGRKLLILGAEASAISERTDTQDLEVLHNEAYRDGLSTSIHRTVNHLVSTAPEIQGILFMVCDQPTLHAGLLTELIHTHQTGKITASRYAETIGVPMMIDRKYWPELLTLTGDKGAKAVVKKHFQDLLLVDFPTGAFDVDTEADVDYLKRLE